MIDWLTSIDGDKPFLITDERVWSYGETVEAVRSRTVQSPVLLRPGLTPESVFDCLAAMAGGGGILLAATQPEPLQTDTGGAAVVIYTSGSSGEPKGARLTQLNLEAASRASTAHLGHGPDDTWLLFMGLHHVAGLSIVVRSAFAGGAVRMIPRFDPVAAAHAMRQDVTMVSVVPTMLHQMLEFDSGPYDGLRAVLVGGGPIPAGLLERASEAGLPVLPSYGMTETFGQVATLRPGAELAYRAHPLPGIDLRLDDAGRIQVKGEQVSPGYLGRPDRESAWLTTGDLGDFDHEGALRVLGRADMTIVTGGENVDPMRVEAEIAEEGGESVVVVGVPDDEWGTVLVAIHTSDLPVEAIDAALRSRLPRHMVPTRWLRLSEVPTTALGKPDRPALARIARESDL